MSKVRQSKLVSLLASRPSMLVAVVVAVGVMAAGYALMRTGAAGFFAAIEVETVGVSGGASVVNDAGASGGKAIRFAASSPTPTPTPPPPVPNPTPPPPTGGTGAGCLTKPGSCGYPDATNTGVPAGTTLSPSGSITVSQAGAVIQNLDINGTVTINAQNVVIKKSRIRITGSPARGIAVNGSVTIEDTTIIADTPNVTIGYGNFTLRRVNMSGGVDSVRADGNVTIEDSYLHDLNRTSGSHNDILQTINGSNITIRHNTLYPFKGAPGSWANGGSGDPMNGAYQFGNFSGNSGNILVENNLVNGGNYTFNVNWTNVDAGKASVSNIRIINNRFGRDHRYGPVASAVKTHGVVWSGNKYIDNGAAIN